MYFQESECLTLPSGSSVLRRLRRVKERLESETRRVKSKAAGAAAGTTPSQLAQVTTRVLSRPAVFAL